MLRKSCGAERRGHQSTDTPSYQLPSVLVDMTAGKEATPADIPFKSVYCHPKYSTTIITIFFKAFRTP